MLKDSNVCAVLAVKDLAEAKEFYGGKLGLVKDMEDEGGISYESGSGMLFVYKSEFAGSNKATAAAWDVKDIEGAVTDLKSKGINFESYDFPGVEKQGDIHIMGNGGVKGAWFKDPSGNILNLVEGM